MEEDSFELENEEFTLSPRSIRFIESRLQAHLKDLEKRFDEPVIEISTLCDIVREQILNYEDEAHLSKNQNNRRRIHIAAQLMTEICFIHGVVVDCEFTEIINDLLQLEKYKRLSTKIREKTNLELKREKLFIVEARRRLLQFVKDGADSGKEAAGDEEREPRVEQISEPDIENFQVEKDAREKETADVASIEMGESPSERLEDEARETLANMTQMRAEPSGEASRLHVHESDFPEVRLEGTMQPEISFKAPSVRGEEDVGEILEILNEGMGEIHQPENVPASPGKDREVPEDEESLLGKDVNGLESSNGWSLPSVDWEQPRKKKRCPPIMDSETRIHGYATRALELNSRQNQVERVRVYEGPPRLMRAFTDVSHLMTIPGFRNSLLGGVRSSRLEELFKRHVRTDKRQPERPRSPPKRPEEDKERDANATKIQTVTEIIEEYGVREGMRALPEKSILQEVLENIRPEFQIQVPDSAVEVPNRETLIGIPMSRIMTPNIEPPDLETINAARPVQSARMKSLQGKSLQPDGTPPWAFTAAGSPPEEKWREFRYVRGRVEEYWKLCQVQGTQRALTLRELMSLEGGNGVADYLTALRILDKLSIRQEILLEHTDGDVVIKPFEVPYVSENQFALRGKDPLF